MVEVYEGVNGANAGIGLVNGHIGELDAKYHHPSIHYT